MLLSFLSDAWISLVWGPNKIYMHQTWWYDIHPRWFMVLSGPTLDYVYMQLSVSVRSDANHKDALQLLVAAVECLRSQWEETPFAVRGSYLSEGSLYSMYSDTTSTCIHCMGPLTRQNVWVSLVCESIQEVPGGIIYCQLRLPQSSLWIQMYSDTIVWAPSADKSLQSKLQGCFSASCFRTVHR